MRIFRVAPVNPLLMSGEEREKAAGTFQRLISQLHADERIQVLVEGRPVNLEELLDDCRREVEACAGPPPARERAARDPLSLSRWRLYAALEESLRLHADGQAAVEVSHYVVVPFLPRQHVARAALAYWRRGKLPTAPLERTLTAHRRAVREHLGRVDASARRARGRGDGDRAARRRAGRAPAVGPLQLDQSRSRTAHGTGRRAAGRARRARRARGGAPGRREVEGGDRLGEPRLRPRLPARLRRPRRGADGRGRHDRRPHDDGMAALRDADPPAVRAVRIRPRAGAPARAPAAEARLPAAVHDQPRRGVPRAGAGLRPLRAGARVRGAAQPARHRPADRPVPRLDLRAAARPRPRPGPERAVGGGRLLHRADRVSRRLQGQRRHLPPAAAVGERAARWGATSPRRCASTRPSTRPTCCR